jgi:AcrR family transcriptional regulator
VGRSTVKRSPASEISSLTARLGHGNILAAAIEIFTKKGLDATRVEDLLVAAKVARRTFYRHFRSKEDVLVMLYEFASSELLTLVGRAIETTGDPLEAIHMGADVYLDYHSSNAALLRVMVEQSLRSESQLAPLRRLFRERLIGMLKSALEGVGKPVDAKLLIALLSALEGLSLELLQKGAPADEIERTKETMHVLLDRVLGLPARRSTR